MKNSIDQLLWVLTKDMKEGESFTFTIVATKQRGKVRFLQAAASEGSEK